MTQRLRLRLSCEDSDVDANQPASARSADILTGTHSGLSTIQTSSSMTGTREVLSDVSRQLLSAREISLDTGQRHNGSTSEDNTSQNAVDSGAFSGNNTGKSQEALDSQRSDRQAALGAARDLTAQVLSALPPSGELMLFFCLCRDVWGIWRPFPLAGSGVLGMWCIDVVFVVGFVKMVSRYDF